MCRGGDQDSRPPRGSHEFAESAHGTPLADQTDSSRKQALEWSKCLGGPADGIASIDLPENQPVLELECRMNQANYRPACLAKGIIVNDHSVPSRIVRFCPKHGCLDVGLSFGIVRADHLPHRVYLLTATEAKCNVLKRRVTVIALRHPPMIMSVEALKELCHKLFVRVHVEVFLGLEEWKKSSRKRFLRVRSSRVVVTSLPFIALLL